MAIKLIDSVAGEIIFIMGAKVLHSDKRKTRRGEFFLRK
jgi:hypothetical protein